MKLTDPFHAWSQVAAQSELTECARLSSGSLTENVRHQYLVKEEFSAYWKSNIS